MSAFTSSFAFRQVNSGAPLDRRRVLSSGVQEEFLLCLKACVYDCVVCSKESMFGASLRLSYSRLSY